MYIKRFGLVPFIGVTIFLSSISYNSSGVFTIAQAQYTPDGLTDIPYALITYKYAPEKLSDEKLKSSLRQIIGQEQMYYKWKKQNIEIPPQDAFFIFTEEQVADRAVDFAAEDLLGEYKSFLSKEAAAIPDQVRLDRYLNLSFFKYENGAIKLKTWPNFHKFSVIDERKKKSIPALGAREIFLGGFALRSEVNSPGFAKLPRYLDQPQLAIDRVPTIPSVAMPRDEAEKLFIRPEECGLPPSTYRLNQPEPDPKVLAAYQACIERIQRYNKGYRLSFLVTIEGFLEGTNILALRLDKVEIYSPHNDLIKTFLASDLPAATDPLAEKKAAEEKAVQEQIERNRVEAIAKAAMSTKIGGADIVGLTLSMSYSDAESAVRSKLEMGRVRESKSTETRNPFFSDMTQFENIDGSERIMLFRAKPNSEKLVGIGRMLDLPEGTTLEDIKNQLIAKYGEPTGTYRVLSIGLTWHGHKEEKACPGIQMSKPPRSIIEGKRLPGYEQYGSFRVSPSLPPSSSPIQWKSMNAINDVLKNIRDKCSPQLFVSVSQASRMLVVLLDSPAFASENIGEEVPVDLKVKF